MTTILRTAEHRFAKLVDFPYRPHYVADLPGFETLRIAYLDEGAPDAERTFLCLHGQPTWGYLYRKMIPVFLASDARVVVPDLVGFGRSDKPVDDDFYTFAMHRHTIVGLVERLDLRNITLVVQDWGGLLGLTLPVTPDMQSRISRLILMNTALAVGEPLGAGFDAWRAFAGSTDDLAVGELLLRAQPGLSADEATAYDAPFEDARFKAGVRAFPKLVMTEPQMAGVDVSRAAARFWREEWRGPTFMACGALDPVFDPAHMQRLADQIRGCPPPLVIEDAGHFAQERGEVIAQAALDHFAASSPERPAS
jgi:pimeloyl-ACP methyl ester carboxylesterase